MPTPKIEERTLYPPIINYLQSLGFKAIGETNITDKHPDILFQLDTINFIIEVKLGKPSLIAKAVPQAYDYARKLGTQNIIIIIFPESIRNEAIIDNSIVENIALNKKVQTLLLTDIWTENIEEIDLKSLFPQLLTKLKQQDKLIDFNTILKIIGELVTDLNSIMFQINTENLISEVVNKLDLFSMIGEFKDKETARNQVVNLASYLLFNQILFYHIYFKKRKINKEGNAPNSVPELEEIKEIDDLQGFFDKITEIDYQTIYQINILGYFIPNSRYCQCR